MKEETTRAEYAKWWHEAVIYQVYLRSYSDSDGDGNGDLAGLFARLSHIADMGVDAIWLGPWYESPMVDNGYDVSDYRAVAPMFGDLRAAEELIEKAHGLGLRVILDMVANHCSDQHPWFQAALAAEPGSPERARFHFADGRGPDGQQPPNDWISAFGGLAWTRTLTADGSPGQWYLHLFAPEQPDLNWDNAEVQGEFADIFRFWLDRGVDGLRVDAASAFAKAPGLPDFNLPTGAPFLPATWQDSPFWDFPDVHRIHREFRALVDSYPGDRMLVGEVITNGPARLADYLRPDELHTAFNLDLVRQPWSANAFRSCIDGTLAALAPVSAPASWVLSSHDETRHLTRFALEVGSDGEPVVDLARGHRRARAALMMMLALPGSAYIYQGEELGLPEAWVADEDIRDPIFTRSQGALRGRDGARVPLPWSGDAPSYGFSPSGLSWLPQPADWGDLTVGRQHGDPQSMLSFYRAAISLRSRYFAHAGALSWRASEEGVLHFARAGGARCQVNLTGSPVAIEGDPILASIPVVDGLLLPDCAAWLL